MYKKKWFHNMQELLDFLNSNRISEKYVISIIPNNHISSDTGDIVVDGYDLVYKEVNLTSQL